MWSVIITLLVFASICLQRVGGFRVPMWLAMTVGAVLVLLLGQISWPAAWASVQWSLIGYLLGVFIIGAGLEQSQWLAILSERLLRVSKHVWVILLGVIILSAVLSAFLMNDTIAICLTPLVLFTAKQLKQSSVLWLLTLCFAITLGSCLTPFGNPQNLLIATQAPITTPMLMFYRYLFWPTMINLCVLFVWMLWLFRKTPGTFNLQSVTPASSLKSERWGSVLSLFLLVAFILWHSVSDARHWGFVPAWSYLSLCAALPVMLCSSKPKRWLVHVDWRTLVFFIAMFVLMASVWNSGLLQAALAKTHLNLHHSVVVLWLSALVSQFISNVPAVALYLPVLKSLHVDVHQYMALAAGSTLAGHFLILGAASNVIVLQQALQRKDSGFGFWDFVRVGVPLGVVNLLVYWFFLSDTLI